MYISRPVRCLLFGGLLLAVCRPVEAGTIELQWNPVPGATGYRVHYGTKSGDYTHVLEVGPKPSATLKGLTDCTTWYLAVKAHNRSVDSPDFSNEISGWPRPEVISVSPSARMQGSQFTLEIEGTNFQPGATIEIDNPNVFFDSTTTVSCKRIKVAAAIEPTARGVRAAEIGHATLTVINPDDVFGVRPQAFEVRIDPARFDLDRRPGPSEGRLDGRDTIWLSRLFAAREGQADYYPDADFNGDGWIDGNDLAYLVSNLGKCWNGSNWSLSACPKP